MRLAPKLTLLLAIAAAAPLLVYAAIVIDGTLRLTRERIDELYAAQARTLAIHVDAVLRQRVESFTRVAEALPYDADDEEALTQTLVLIAKQLDAAESVALFDAAGRSVGAAVHTAAWEAAQGASVGGGAQASASATATAAAATSFAANVPLEEALETGFTAIGPVFPGPDLAPRLVLALRVGPAGRPMVLAAQVNLSEPVAPIRDFRAGSTGFAYMVDQQRRAIVHRDDEALRARAETPGAVLGATAEVSLTGWTVAVVQAREEAMAPVRRQTFLAVLIALSSLTLSVVAGSLVVRTVTSRLSRLRDQAAGIGAGDLDTVLEVATSGHDELADLSSAFNEMVHGLRERDRLRRTFSQYVSDPVAERVLSEDQLTRRGRLLEVTVVFVDLREYSAYAEHTAPQEVFDLLNQYFDAVVDVVSAHQGFVSKFIGDSVMAIFGGPEDARDPELRAVQCALQVQERIREISEARTRLGQHAACFGIGINTGPAIAGNLGSVSRMEYTVIGDAVNVAQRLQGHARAEEVLISAATYERVSGRVEVEAKGPLKVKGRETPIEAYRVKRTTDPRRPPSP